MSAASEVGQRRDVDFNILWPNFQDVMAARAGVAAAMYRAPSQAVPKIRPGTE
jgi:hypothetical protein